MSTLTETPSQRSVPHFTRAHRGGACLAFGEFLPRVGSCSPTTVMIQDGPTPRPAPGPSAALAERLSPTLTPAHGPTAPGSPWPVHLSRTPLALRSTRPRGAGLATRPRPCSLHIYRVAARRANSISHWPAAGHLGVFFWGFATEAALNVNVQTSVRTCAVLSQR